LFFYGQESIDIDRIEPLTPILNELDTKERKLRSLRGFFLYALEIMNNGKDLQILTTNLKISFWRNLKTILRQNKKEVLLRFLFGRGYSYQGSISNSDTIEMIQNLQNQVNSLQQKVNNLEIQLKNSEYALRSQKKAPDDTKISQLGKNISLKPNTGSYLQEYDEVQKVDSEASKSPLKPLSQSQHYNFYHPYRNNPKMTKD
jgi:hypothetical protein